MLSIHYSGTNSFLLVNTTKIYQFKAKDSEIKPYTVCIGNTSKDFTINVYEKTGLNRVVKVFSIDYNAVNTSNILDIHRYLMKETSYEIMFLIYQENACCIIKCLHNSKFR